MSVSTKECINQYEKVKLLFDYTKFHIGLYTTLGSILVALFASGKAQFQFYTPALWVSIGFIALAGFAGGVIASTLPDCDSLEQFFKERIGPWGLEWFSGLNWTRIEHTAFWIGLFAGLTSFALG